MYTKTPKQALLSTSSGVVIPVMGEKFGFFLGISTSVVDHPGFPIHGGLNYSNFTMGFISAAS